MATLIVTFPIRRIRPSGDTLFQMGSTSKSFTAAVILKLEAAGKLSLDDPLRKWLPQSTSSATMRRDCWRRLSWQSEQT
jgi:CubicO group peptidase (beta-lactamase class C family)